MAMFETLVQLFAAFAKIGFTSFGGTSMIPLIMDEMSSHGWMTDADLTNLIAIAEMTPGSLGVNAATFAGTKTAGMPGGVFAVLGVLSPTLTLTLLAAAFFQKFRTSRVMSYIMKIVKPVCIGMVLGVAVMEAVNYVINQTPAQTGNFGGSIFLNPTLDLGVAVSATVVLVIAGLIAGYVPAYRAAQLKTIDALRYNK